MEDLKQEISIKKVILPSIPYMKCFEIFLADVLFFCLFQGKLENITFACDELVLADDGDGKIPYFIGEIFIYQDLESTQVNNITKRLIILCGNSDFRLVQMMQNLKSKRKLEI